MTLGMIGLGRMGANMTERLVRGGHRMVGYARKQEARERVEAKRAESAASLEARLCRRPFPHRLSGAQGRCSPSMERDPVT